MLPAGTGEDTIADYCGTQCFYDNVVEADPTNAEHRLHRPARSTTTSAPAASTAPPTAARPGRASATTCTPTSTRSRSSPTHPANVAIGNDGGVWYFANRGGRTGAGDPLSAADWQDLNGTVDPVTAAVLHRTGLQITQFTSISTNPAIPARLWGGSQDNGTERRSIASDSWFDVGNGDGGQVLVDPNTGGFVFGTFFGVSPYRFSRRRQRLLHQPVDHPRHQHHRPVGVLHPLGDEPGQPEPALPRHLPALPHQQRRDTRRPGRDWTPISPDLTGGCTGAAPNGARGCVLSAVGVDGGDGVYTGSDDGLVFVSPNAVTAPARPGPGSDKGPLPARPVTQFAVDRSDWRVAYAAYAGFNGATRHRPGHVFATTDGGKHWTDVSGNLPDTPVNSIILDPRSPKTLYAGTDVGTSSPPTAAALGAAGHRPAGRSVWQLAFDPSHRKLAAGTHGRGAFTSSDPTLARRWSSPHRTRACRSGPAATRLHDQGPQHRQHRRDRCHHHRPDPRPHLVRLGRQRWYARRTAARPGPG